MNINDPQLKIRIEELTTSIKNICGDNLLSIVLYGGVAKNDYTVGKSNVNVLFIFDKVDLDVLDSIALLFQKGMADFRLSPFILTSSEIVPSSDVFAVKFFDIQKHHLVIYGKDFLKDLSFDPAHLRFISEQELRNQLSRMKYFYVQNFNLPENLLSKVQKGMTTLLVNANTLLHLKHQKYFATREEIAGQLILEPGMNSEVLANLMRVKENPEQFDTHLARKAYDELMVSYKQLLKLFNQLEING